MAALPGSVNWDGRQAMTDFRIVIDTERCVGSGQCVMAAPDVFDQNDRDGTALALTPTPAQEHVAAVREAARLCPSRAIMLKEH